MRLAWGPLCLAVAVVSVASLAGAAAVAQQPPQPSGEGVPMTPAERAYRAGRVYAAALTYFAHWADAPDAKAIDAAYRAYVEAALAAEDRPAFTRASMRFLASFRNGHTLFFDSALAREGSRLPFLARPIAGRWVVTASAVPELRAGDVLETIEGRPFDELLRELRPMISTSAEQWTPRAPFVRMPGMAVYTHLLPERFELGVAGGRRVAIDRHAMPDVPIGGTEGRWLERGKVAYIRVPSFLVPENEKRALELVRGEYKDAEALVVDVRSNGGGSTPSELTRALMDRAYRWWTESTPASLPYFRLRAGEGKWEYQPFGHPDFVWRGGTSEPAADGYRGRLAILVDGGCFSSCEDFSMPFKDNGRAILVGETTGGSTGQPYFLDLGDGMAAVVGAKRAAFPDGSRFEGVGIRPDAEVTPTIEDLRAGRDAVLDEARRLLSQPAASPKSAR
jgi:carboxyl-terminal processing protease